MTLPVAVQLYTLRDLTKTDFVGTMEKVAAMGYEGVEFAGFGGLDAKELKSVINKLGLKAAGSHVGIDMLREKLEEVIEYHLEIGCKYIICPWAKLEKEEEYVELAAFLDKAGALCREKGLVLAYHNHDFEFKVINGEKGLDMLYRLTDPANLSFELDTCWVYFSGNDPVEYVKKYSGRLPLVHLKDLKSMHHDDFAILGEGIINVKEIAAASSSASVEWVVVELDSCPGEPLFCVEQSLKNCRKMSGI